MKSIAACLPFSTKASNFSCRCAGMAWIFCLLSLAVHAQSDTTQYHYAQISLSNNGTLLYVRSTRDNKFNEIFVASAKGAQAKKMASGMVPKWSPDGASFLYSVSRGQFFISGMDTSLKTDPFKNSTAHDLVTATFSRDGKSIIFSQGAPPTADISIMNRETREIKQVTAGPGLKWGADISPDGKYMVYAYFIRAADRTITDRGIIVKDLASGEEKKISGFGEYPIWSHNGKSIAFFGHNNNEKPSHIYTVNPDGTGLRQLTEGEADETPQWGPGDKQIFFVTRNTAGLWEIWTMNADGTAKEKRVGNRM